MKKQTLHLSTKNITLSLNTTPTLNPSPKGRGKETISSYSFLPLGERLGIGGCKKAFTLVELIVVITILAILGTIAFISLQGYSKDARDAKRISDTRSILSKIVVEQALGTSLEDLIVSSKENNLTINGSGTIGYQGIPNYDELGEDVDSFRDPSNNEIYPIAYAEGGSGTGAYSFVEMATVSESDGRARIVGNYYKLNETIDSPSLFTQSGTTGVTIPGDYIVDMGDVPPYDIGVPVAPLPNVVYACTNDNGVLLANANTTNTTGLEENTEYQATDENLSCYYECKETYSGANCESRLVFGDEDEEAILACNEWVKQAVNTQGGGYANWLWVPARHFISDGLYEEHGIGVTMNDNYYLREINYNGIDYTCNGFAVMKYEATYNEATTVNSTGGGADWNTYVYNSGLNAVSMADRYPIADITQPNAITACKNIGANFHLITNNEWMTIARNIEQQASNWPSNSIGVGYISNGLSADTTHGCAGANSKATYSVLPRNWATKTGVGTGIGTNTDCDTKRQLALSTGEKIWDLSGNVREHVNKANTVDPAGTGHNSASFRLSNACGGNNWYSFSGNDGYAQCGYTNGYTNANVGPATAGMNANNGIGRIYSYNTASNVFLRGASADYSANAGLFTLLLDRSDTYWSRNVGFRCSL